MQDGQGQIFYTRRGDLRVDDRGRLVTADGLAYLDRNGAQIVVGDADEMPTGNLKISADGEITEDGGDGRRWGPMDVVGIPNRNALVPIGEGVYRDTLNQITTPQSGSVRQGYLEQSNVQTVDELCLLYTSDAADD